MARPRRNQDGDNVQSIKPVPEMTDNQIKQTAAKYERSKADMDEARGEIGQMIKQFEEDGGHKKALKTAVALKNMESSKAQDYWRALQRYCNVLGVWDQGDMLDHAQAAE